MRAPDPRVTYTVPGDPPPVVHLRALAEDGVGHHSEDNAEFPTLGDWYGTLKAHGQGNIYNDRVTISFAFSESPDGTVSGRGRAILTGEPQRFAGCLVTRQGPPFFDFPITGRKVGEQFQLELPNQPVSFTLTAKCDDPKRNKTSSGRAAAFVAFATGADLFLRPKVPARDGATNELHTTNGPFTVDGEIEIHRVKKK